MSYAASYSSLRVRTRPAQSKASACSLHRCRATPVCRAAKVWRRSEREPAASITALAATTVPAEPNAPVSCRTTSVSDWRTAIRSTVVFSAPAVICLWTVVVPLPNSAVPTAMSYVPSRIRLTRASA